MQKTLSAGTKKYLLLDDARIQRNAERTKRGEPIVMVAEVDGDVITLHRATTVQITEAVHLEYSQHRPLPLGRGVTAHAAYVTTGEITLDPAEPTGMTLSAPTTEPAAEPTGDAQPQEDQPAPPTTPAPAAAGKAPKGKKNAPAPTTPEE